jgi:hypothetical protein
MRTTIKLFSILALALATFSQYTTASAGDIWKVQRWSADAYLVSTDPSGCISTSVSVYLEDFVEGSSGPGNPQSRTFLSVYRFNECTHTVLIDAGGFASLADSNFQFSRNLDSATLNATVHVQDFVSNSSFDVLVDLTWTGTSSLQHNNIHYKVGGPDCYSIWQETTAFRDADISGTVSAGETDFAAGTSVNYAHISLSKSRNIAVGCN